jgi:hypothetical protein
LVNVRLRKPQGKKIPLHPPFSKGETKQLPPFVKGGWGDLDWIDWIDWIGWTDEIDEIDEIDESDSDGGRHDS